MQPVREQDPFCVPVIQPFHKILRHLMEHSAEFSSISLLSGRKITEFIVSFFRKYKLRYEDQVVRIKQMSLYFIDHLHKLLCKIFQVFSFHFLQAVHFFHA